MAGPSEVYICHLCVALCTEILAHEALEGRPGPPDPPGEASGRGPLVRTEVISS